MKITEYISTQIPDSLSVTGIYTVLTADLSRKPSGLGESHNFPEIFYLSRGSHTLGIDGKEYLLKAGQMIIYAPGAVHKTITPSSSEASIISFDISGSNLDGLYNRIITLNGAQKQIFKSIFDVAVDCFEGRKPGGTIGGMILKAGVGDHVLQKIKKQLEYFLVDIYNATLDGVQKSAKDLRWDSEFERAVEFLKSNVSKNLTLSEIAEGCSVSVSKLKMLFRERRGTGPINLFNELKIEKAKELINEGKLNFTEIADSLGFSSLHYFSRLFKKITGLSPSSYSGGV